MTRQARASDLPQLAHVEASAAQRFRGTPLDWLADAPVTPAPALLAGVARGTLWIADGAGDAVGFLFAEPVGPWLHILELSVALAAQGCGHGSALLAAARDAAPGLGCDRLSLTTDRFIAWNAPWYAARGFVEIPVADQPGWLAAILMREVAHGLDPTRRVAMQRHLG